MCQRVEDKEREPEGSAQARFDAGLGVRYWRLPGRVAPVPAAMDEGAPYWWRGDEDASQAFLTAQGVTL